MQAFCARLLSANVRASDDVIAFEGRQDLDSAVGVRQD